MRNATPVVVGPVTYMVEDRTALQIAQAAARAWTERQIERAKELVKIAAKVEDGSISDLAGLHAAGL